MMFDPASMFLKLTRMIGLVFLWTAPLIFVLGVFFLIRTVIFLSQGSRADGTVVEMESQTPGGGGSSRPVFTFVDQHGERHTVGSNLWRDPPAHEVGEAVSVIYDPNHRKSAKIDSFMTIWLKTLLCGLGSLSQLFLGLMVYFYTPIQMKRATAGIIERKIAGSVEVAEMMSIGMNPGEPGDVVKPSS